MRVVLAPDCFGGTLSAVEAADALARGWRSVSDGDRLDLVPMSDGGPGLLDTLDAAITGAQRVAPGVLRAGRRAFVESAVACSPEQVRADGRDVRTGTTYGVGELVRLASDLPVEAVIVGLGGSGTNDGGGGLWAALGAQPADLLRGGGIALRELRTLSPPPLPLSPDGGPLRLVAATDVDNPLLGLHGASAVYGPQKGADREAVLALDAALENWAEQVETTTGRPGLRDQPGAGAAGGLGFGLLGLGARRVSGLEVVADAVRLAERVADADLVVTGEGRYDTTSLRGKVVAGVARVAQQAGVPCVVVAGQAGVGSREAAAAGVEEVWSVAEMYGSPGAALSAGADGVAELAGRLARTWSRHVGR